MGLKGKRRNAGRLRALAGARAREPAGAASHTGVVRAEQLCFLAQLSYGVLAGLAVDPDRRG